MIFHEFFERLNRTILVIVKSAEGRGEEKMMCLKCMKRPVVRKRWHCKKCTIIFKMMVLHNNRDCMIKDAKCGSSLKYHNIELGKNGRRLIVRRVDENRQLSLCRASVEMHRRYIVSIEKGGISNRTNALTETSIAIVWPDKSEWFVLKRMPAKGLTFTDILVAICGEQAKAYIDPTASMEQNIDARNYLDGLKAEIFPKMQALYQEKIDRLQHEYDELP